MKINYVNRQSFGTLKIEKKGLHRKEITDSLDAKRRKHLIEDISCDTFQVMTIEKDDTVHVYDMKSRFSKKIDGNNLLDNIREGIDLLMCVKQSSLFNRKRSESYCGGEVSAPTYPFGYSGGGWGY